MALVNGAFDPLLWVQAAKSHNRELERLRRALDGNKSSEVSGPT